MKLNRKAQRQSGSTLIVVIATMATLMVIVGVAVEYTNSVGRNVQRSNTLQTAVAVGDGCIENLFAHWREISRTQSNVAMKTEAFDENVIPLPTGGTSGTQFPSIPNFTATANNYNPSSSATVQQYKVIAVDPQLNPMAANTAPIPAVGQSDDTKTWNYLATAYVTLPAVRGELLAKVQRVFQKEQISPWNWAIFYVDPLEIHPGQDFNVTGWVHTNGILYTASDKLSFLDKVTYGIDWERNWKAGDPRLPTGTDPETPTNPKYLSNLPPAPGPALQPFGMDSTRIFSTADANPNNDSYHELVEPPTSGFADPLAEARYYNKAGVIIEIDGSNTVTFKRPNGDGTARIITASSSGADGDIYDMFAGSITTNKMLQDNREAAQVRLATFSVGVVIDEDNGEYEYEYEQFNGIVYIHDTSAAATGVGAKRGIRIKDARNIASPGLTVASNNPVYIQGDFNTGTAPPSNSGVPSQPTQTGYTRQPCSIVADAVNVLSNSFGDSKLLSDLTGRVASNTTVNAAIVSGIVTTANNVYSGGAENFPRFLENWTDKTFTYYGSMVQLYQSRQSIGKWVYGSNIYEAPIRQWYFDNNFKTDTPPGSPMIHSYVKGRWSLVP